MTESDAGRNPEQGSGDPTPPFGAAPTPDPESLGAFLDTPDPVPPAPLAPPPPPPGPPGAPAAPGASASGQSGQYLYPGQQAAQPAGFPQPMAMPPGQAWDATPAVIAPTGALKFAGLLPRLLAYWLDGIMVGIIVLVVGFMVGGIIGLAGGAGGRATTLAGVVVSLGVSYLWFVAQWTSEGRATLGMRVFHLQIGQAADGRPLTMGQATVRWLAMGSIVGLLGIVPGLDTAGSGLEILWAIVLLITTATDSQRRGLHDKIGGSAIVGQVGNEGPVAPCLVLLVILLVVLPVLSIVGLIFIGGQISDILSQVGQSI